MAIEQTFEIHPLAEHPPVPVRRVVETISRAGADGEHGAPGGGGFPGRRGRAGRTGNDGWRGGDGSDGGDGGDGQDGRDAEHGRDASPGGHATDLEVELAGEPRGLQLPGLRPGTAPALDPREVRI